MRRKDREITDIKEILDIVGKTQILHLGLFDEGYPYVVPLHYGYEYDDGKLIFYMHGGSCSSHKGNCGRIHCESEKNAEIKDIFCNNRTKILNYYQTYK